MRYVEVETKTAFHFGAIRKLLVESWQFTEAGPTFTSDKSEGSLENPLDISSLGIPLSDFKLLNMILSENEHASIKNLEARKVT